MLQAQTPTRYPSGVAVAIKNALFGNFPLPPSLNLHQYLNDFDTYAAGDWTITTTTGTNALVAGNGGLIRLTTAASNGDIQHIAKNPASFALVPGCQAWFLCNLSVSDNLSSLIAGWQAGGTAFAPANFIGFTKASGSANIDFTITNTSVSTTLSAVTTIAPTTPTALGWYYDGRADPTLYVFSSTPVLANTPNIVFGQQYFIGGTVVGSIGAQAPVGVANGAASLANLPAAATNLNLAVGIRAGAVAAKTVDIDYLGGASEVVRY